MAPLVTALVAEPRGRVRIDLDGEPWRRLPAAVVVGARLGVGVELDRSRARALGRELRRVKALTIATTALSHRDHSRAGIGAKLDRRGVAPAERGRAIEALERAGYVDDARFAVGRAASLAARGYGDDAIRFDLEHHGLAADEITVAVTALLPEGERALNLVERLGCNARTARRLATKGFSADSIEVAIGDPDQFKAI